MRPFLFLVIAVTATLISADGEQIYSADPGNYPHHHEISDDTVPEDYMPEVDEVPDIIHIIPIENEDTSPDTVSPKKTPTPNTDYETWKQCARQLNDPCPTGACTYEYRPVDALCENWEKIRFPNCCVLRTEICKQHRNCKLLHKKEQPAFNQY